MGARDVINKILILRDGVTATLRRITNNTVAYKKQLKELKKQGMDAWDNLKSKTSDYAKTMAVVSSAGATALVALGIKANASAEMTERSFEILLHSAAAAHRMIKDLQVLGLKSPFEFEGLQNSAKMLLGMGFAGEQVIPMLYRLGDAVAAVGGTTDQLEGIALAIGQIQTKGKVSAEEMNQLAERGIPAWDLMAKQMGKTKAELMGMAANGKLFADTALPALMDGLKTRFGGAMESMSSTFTYTLANMKEAAMLQLGMLTKPLFMEIKKDLQDLQDFFDRRAGVKWSDEFATGLVKVYQGVKGVAEKVWDVSTFVANNWTVIEPIVWGVVAAVVALKGVMVALTVQQLLLNTAMSANPLGLIILGVAALVSYSVWLMNVWDDLPLYGKAALTALGGPLVWLVAAARIVIDNWSAVKDTSINVWNVMVDGAEWGANKLIGWANVILNGYKFTFDFILYSGATVWNGLIDQAEQGARRIAYALSLITGQSYDIDFGTAKFQAERPTWGADLIPKVDLSRMKKSTGFQDDLAQARAEQNDIRKAQRVREVDRDIALKANTDALKFNSEATAGNTSATDKNTKAKLKEAQTPLEIADGLLARIERHAWQG